MKEEIDFKYVSIEENPDIAELPLTTTQCMAFCKYEDTFCIVRDFDEDHWSLPGGGCEPGERSLDCLRREVFEEAQFDIKNIKLLGRVIVTTTQDEIIISRTTHDRYICDVKILIDFFPRKNGFEIVERRFITIDEIQEKVMLLQNSTGDALIQQIKRFHI